MSAHIDSIAKNWIYTLARVNIILSRLPGWFVRDKARQTDIERSLNVIDNLSLLLY